MGLGVPSDIMNQRALSVSSLGFVIWLTSCSSEPTHVVRVPAPAGAYYIKTVGGVGRPVPKPPTTSVVTEVKPQLKRFGFFNWAKKPTKPSEPKVEDDGWWMGNAVSGKPSMTINLTEQKVFYYKGGELVGMAPISSGREGNETVAGSFKIIEKDIDHRSSLYGDYVGPDGEVLKREVDVRKDPRPPGGKFDGAEMNYFMRITGAIGMHEGYLPGYPASHGCIRLPKKMAMIFYENTPLGTPVKIVR